jgi:hypothetical protein
MRSSSSDSAQGVAEDDIRNVYGARVIVSCHISLTQSNLATPVH